MIECKNLCIDYSRKSILRNISFVAQCGKITVILGKNGCGKTTLLRAVAGNLSYSGNIEIDGVETKSLSASARAKMVSLMPQIQGSPDITVGELVSFGRQPYTGITGILSHNDKHIVETVIEKTGLTALADKRLGCISGGELQKAYFALLLSQQTKNLLLDEPGSHIDAFYTNHLMKFLRDEKENGKTVLAIFHDINRAIDIADKIIVIDNESIIFQGDSDSFCDSKIPEQIFGLNKYLCTVPTDAVTQRYCYL